MIFQDENYTVIEEAVSKELATFLYNYFKIRRLATNAYFNHKIIKPEEKMFGTYNDPQIPNTFSIYGDVAFDTLLIKLQNTMQEVTGLSLYPNYSYARLYKTGDELHRHKDRFSCEISTTLFLGGDKWPIFLEPSGKKGRAGKKIDLNVGDMLVYKGNILEHWRDPFSGAESAQVFLHYTNTKTKGALENIYDGRPHVGIPNDKINRKV